MAGQAQRDSSDRRGCLLSTRDSPLFTAAQLQVPTLFMLMTPESLRSACVGGAAGAQVGGGGREEGRGVGKRPGSLQPCLQALS